jgi:Ca2+/H+ antiporter
VNRSALRFWGSAAAASIAFAALVPLLIPYRAIGLDPAAERDFVWQLSVFCTGVMLVLFGLGAWISGRRSIGLRDVMEAGGVRQALDRAGQRDAGDAPYTRNAAVWCTVTGALLLIIYFVLYAALG